MTENGKQFVVVVLCVDIVSLLSLLPRLTDRVSLSLLQAVKQCSAARSQRAGKKYGEGEGLRSSFALTGLTPPLPLLCVLLASLCAVPTI